MTKKEELLFYTAPINDNSCINIQMALENISAGFPSPAENYTDGTLDLNSLLIKNPPATFFVKVSGDSMLDAGINPGDILIVDRSLEVNNNDIIIAAVDGEFTVKRFYKRGKTIKLIPENQSYNEIIITQEMEFEIWGIVTNVIHRFRK